MTRPCWFIGFALLIGCLTGAWLPTNLLLVATVGITFITILLAAVPLLRRRRALLLSFVGLTIAFLSVLATQWYTYLPLTHRVGETVSFTAQVTEREGTSYLTVTDGDLPKGVRLQLWAYDGGRTPRPYEQVEGTFVLRDYGEQGLALLQRKTTGVWFAVTPEKMTIRAGNPPWTAWFATLREQAVAKIGTYLSGDVGALVSGICFGADTALSEEAKAAFRVSGTYHLFSVSGFHMALLSQALLFLLSRLRVPRFWRAAICIMALLFFVAMVGHEPSVIRSGLLCLLVMLATCFRRQADTCNSLGLALIVLLVASPFAAYDVSLLLSFFATFGLVFLCPRITRLFCRLLSPRIRETHGRLATAYDTFATTVALSVSATIATLPVSLLYFGEISVIAVLGNLLTAFPSSLLLVTGFVACVCIGPLLQPLATVLFFVTGQLSRYLLWISEKISTFPLVSVAITTPYLLLWVIGMVVLAVVGYTLARRNGLAIVAAIGALTLGLSYGANTWFMRGVAEITALPTQNDVAVCVEYQGKTVLVCAPEHTDTVYRMRTALRLSGIRRVDALVIPFGNATTITTLLSVCNDVFSASQLWYGEEMAWLSPRFAQAQPLPETDTAVIDGVNLCRYKTALHLAVNQTDLLCCMTEDSVRSLPFSLWHSEVVVFGKAIPPDALLLQAEIGLWQNVTDARPTAASCGVQTLLSVTGERITLTTRGVGDITY